LKKGILIRSNIVSFKDEDGVVHSVLNNERVPGNSRLIREIPFVAGEKTVIEVYCVK